MKAASDDLKALLASGQFFMADLYEFTLPSGLALYYTSFDQDITADGHTYSSLLGWQRTKWKLALGLNIDTMDVTLQAEPTDYLPGTTTPVIESIAAGDWDGASATVKRAFMASPGDVSAGTIAIFPNGWIGPITEIGRIKVQMQLRSKLALLNVALPKRLFQPSCSHVLYDAGCTLNRNDFKTSGAVQSGSTQKVIVSGTAETSVQAGPTAAPTLSSTTKSDVNLPPDITYYAVATYVTGQGETTASPESSWLIAPTNGVLRVASPASVTGATGWNVYIGASPGDEQLQNGIPLALGSSYEMAGSGIYLSGIKPPQINNQGASALGTIQFTSGANAGLRRVIESSDASGTLTLRSPLFNPVVAGDTFDVFQGCDHTLAQCTNTFSNAIHFAGCQFIPVPEIGSA